jgi:hypothetical protein
VLWQLCAITATLFRIEAITYLVLLPSLFLFSFNMGFKERIRYFLISHALNIFLALGLVLAITLHGDLSIKNFGRLQEVFTLNPYDELTRRLFSKAAIMSNEVLGKYLEEFAVQGLLLTFIYVIASKIISATGLLNVILAGFTIKNRKTLLEPKTYSALRFAIIISLANIALIITKVFVLSSRYVAALAWLLMILAAFMLTELTQKVGAIESKKSAKKLAYTILISFLLLSVVKNIMPKQAGYNYQQDAMTWLNTYNTQHENVLIDDSRLRYYAEQPFRIQKSNLSELENAYNNKTIYQHSILVVSSTNKNSEGELFVAKNLPEYREIKRFSNGKASKHIVIYELAGRAALNHGQP